MKRSVEEYTEALYESVAANPKEAKELIRQFVDVLRANGDEKLLPMITERLSIVDQEKNHYLIARVETAQELTKEQEEQIAAKLKNHFKVDEVQIQQEVKPELIGGIKIYLKDEIIDNSVKSKLERLAAKL